MALLVAIVSKHRAEMARWQRALRGSPRHPFAEVKIAAGWAVGGERGQFDAGFAPFAQLQRRGRAAHLGFDPTGMGRVDLDRRVPQLGRQMDRERVERGLGRVVSGSGKGAAAIFHKR
jgi:hypothetical protein